MIGRTSVWVIAWSLGVCVLFEGAVVTPALGRHPGVLLNEVLGPVATSLIVGTFAIAAVVLVVIIVKLLRK
jgi:hypothetical protein